MFFLMYSYNLNDTYFGVHDASNNYGDSHIHRHGCHGSKKNCDESTEASEQALSRKSHHHNREKATKGLPDIWLRKRPKGRSPSLKHAVSPDIEPRWPIWLDWWQNDADECYRSTNCMPESVPMLFPGYSQESMRWSHVNVGTIQNLHIRIALVYPPRTMLSQFPTIMDKRH